MLRGIKDGWNSKKNIDWEKLFAFLKKYINRMKFWQNKLGLVGDHLKPDKSWVISMVGNLIQDGTKDDSWAFERHNNQIAQEILFIIIDKDIDELRETDVDRLSGFVADSMNTTLGITTAALIYLALRIVRIQKLDAKKEKPKWSYETKRRYKRLLKKEVIEAL